MEHYRLRKYRGPEVWERVRAAYEAGESGTSVARRFDVGLSNLRKKARMEGWTRKDIARRLDRELEPRRPDAGMTPGPVSEPARPVDPREAVEQAMHRAGGLLAEGRGGEAQSLIRSAESLARLVERTEPKGADVRGDETRGDEARGGGGETSQDAIDRHMAERDADIIREATRLAWAMLMDKPTGEAARYSAFLYHWRARHLGPEATACDFAHAVEGGWAARFFDAEGRLRPLPEPIGPQGLMIDQHLRSCARRDARPADAPRKTQPWEMDLSYAGPIGFVPPEEEGIG